jgi:hypothetical protein
MTSDEGLRMNDRGDRWDSVAPTSPVESSSLCVEEVVSVLASRPGAWQPSWLNERVALEQADAFCRQVVDALCLLPDPPERAALHRLLGAHVPGEDLEAALARLAEDGLVSGTAQQPRVSPSLRARPYPAGLGPPLAGMVAHRTARDLAALAERIGVRPERTKVSTVTALAAGLAEPARVAALVARGPAGTAELAEQLAAGPPALSVRGGTYSASPRLPDGWLLHHGLLMESSWNTALMPREVAVALRGGQVFPHVQSRRPALPVAPVEPAAVDRLAAERALRLVHDVTALLRETEQTPLPLLKTGGAGVRELRRLAKLVDRDETTVARLLELAAASGLLGAWVPETTALPLPAYDDWRALGSTGCWGHLLAGWLAWDAQLFEAGEPDSRGRPVPPLQVRSAEPFAGVRRRSVLAALGESPGAGKDPEALAARLYWDAPAVWGSPDEARRLTGWVLAEAELLGLLADGVLSTVGRLATTRQLRQATAELTCHGPRVVDSFVLQADLTAMVAGEPTPALRSELELLGDLDSTGSASVYRFTETSLRRGFDAGRGADDILGFFDRHASHGVPQPLSYLVGDIARRHGTVRAGTVRGYVRSEDPALLAEILRSKAAGRLGLRRLAPTVLVSSADSGELVIALRAAGWLVVAEGSDGALAALRPTTARATLDPQLAQLRLRQPGSGPCFGPVDRILAAVLGDEDPDDSAAGGAGPEPEEVFFDGDASDRPTWTAYGGADLEVMLELAEAFEWPVGLDTGTGTEQVVYLLERDDAVLFVQALDGYCGALALTDVRAARVLSEDEEDALL